MDEIHRASPTVASEKPPEWLPPDSGTTQLWQVVNLTWRSATRIVPDPPPGVLRSDNACFFPYPGT